VAVLDTGIDNLPDFAGRLVGGVDLAGGNNPYQDSYGHGTFVAGLIAGNGASSNGQYSGEAAGAKLVSIKVAGADGTTHLGTLISGLQWAVDHQTRYGIKVLNISLGFKPSQSTVLNPLDRAVEAVWNSGIAVVASAGNAGPFNGTILSPGDDPLVITAGALDDMATARNADDEMTDFSSAGPTSPDGWVKPDLVTSGRSVVSLAAGLDDLQQQPLGPGRRGELRRLGYLVQHGYHLRGGSAGPGRQPGTVPQPDKGPPARHCQPWAGRQPFHRRSRGPQRLRRGHLGPDELQPVGRQADPDPAWHHGLAVAYPTRGHVEHEPVVGDAGESAASHRLGVERLVVEWRRLERLGLDRQGLE
jgi:subtilisin family serine protease